MSHQIHRGSSVFIHSFFLSFIHSFILTGIISNPPRLSRTMEYSLKGNINSYTILNLLVIPCYYINNLNIYLNIYIFIHSFKTLTQHTRTLFKPLYTIIQLSHRLKNLNYCPRPCSKCPHPHRRSLLNHFLSLSSNQ